MIYSGSGIGISSAWVGQLGRGGAMENAAKRCPKVKLAVTCFDNRWSDLGKCEHCSGACPVAIHLIFASPIFRRMPRQMSWHHWKVGATVACKFSFLKGSKSFGALTMYWCIFSCFLVYICCCVLYWFFVVRWNQTAGGGRGTEAGGRECFYYAATAQA